MTDWLRRLDAGARAILGRRLSMIEAEKFAKYLYLLAKWQKMHRMVGSTDAQWVVDHLFLDSLLFLEVLPAGALRVLDLGAGAGLPGVPLKIVRPSMRLALLEARQRRVSFLRAVVRDLALTDTDVINARAEDVVAERRGTFDAVVMRCAGPVDEVVPLAARFAAAGGLVVVAGPPDAGPVTAVDWIDVARPDQRGTRRLGVHRVRR